MMYLASDNLDDQESTPPEDKHEPLMYRMDGEVEIETEYECPSPHCETHTVVMIGSWDLLYYLRLFEGKEVRLTIEEVD